ncbi:MAG: peroxiredoxin family protein, partial [Planctomycetota bacterium]
AAEIGEPAPAFTLADSTGKSHALADYRGKIVVLQWINPTCPVCRRVCSTGLVTAMRKQLDEITPGVVYLGINSTHYMEPSVGEAYFKTHKIDAPVLIDRDGKVGHLYGAKRTPHLFVIDAEGVRRICSSSMPRGSCGIRERSTTTSVATKARRPPTTSSRPCGRSLPGRPLPRTSRGPTGARSSTRPGSSDDARPASPPAKYDPVPQPPVQIFR